MKINGKTTKIGLLQIDDYNLKIVKSVLEIWLEMVWELGCEWYGNQVGNGLGIWSENQVGNGLGIRLHVSVRQQKLKTSRGKLLVHSSVGM